MWSCAANPDLRKGFFLFRYPSQEPGTFEEGEQHSGGPPSQPRKGKMEGIPPGIACFPVRQAELGNQPAEQQVINVATTLQNKVRSNVRAAQSGETLAGANVCATQVHLHARDSLV
jgi:hypothetical protein